MVFQFVNIISSGLDFLFYILLKIVDRVNKRAEKPHENAVWILVLIDSWFLACIAIPIWSRIVFGKPFSLSRYQVDDFYYKNVGLCLGVVMLLIEYFMYYRNKKYIFIRERFDRWTLERRWNFALIYLAIFLFVFICSFALLIKHIS